jgi:hypothetical protein
MGVTERAKELYESHFNILTRRGEYSFSHKDAVDCSILTVNEIIDSLELYDELTEQSLKEDFGIDYFSCELQNMDSDFRYWLKVRLELQEMHD